MNLSSLLCGLFAFLCVVWSFQVT